MNGVLHGYMIKRSQCVTLEDKDLTDCSFLLAKSRKLALEFVNLQLSQDFKESQINPLRSIAYQREYCFLIQMLISFS